AARDDRRGKRLRLTSQVIAQERPDDLGSAGVTIATTDFGDAIYLRVGPDEGEVVYLMHHDGGDTDVFAESLTQMLTALRHANRGS
ncbi:MAG: hypothetical protein ACREUF_18210, partial [Solimonas sp.]